MKVLVLGGNGFIGSHVVDGLVAAGHTVRVLDRGSERFRALLPSVDYRLGDFSNLDVLAKAMQDIEIVFHLISTTVPSTSNLDPLRDIRENLVSTVRLLQLMIRLRIRKIVYLSSGGTVYGIPEELPIPETHPLRPICSYGAIKVAIENYLHMFHHLYGLDYVVIRASNPFGARQGHLGVQGVINTFLNKIADAEPIEIWGDGNIVRDFIDVRDLAALCVKAVEQECTGIFNAGSGVGRSINEILDIMEQVTGKKIASVRKPGRRSDIPKVVLDITKARREFNWDLRVDFLESLAYTWEWIKQVRS